MILQKDSEEYNKAFAKWKRQARIYGWIHEYEAEQFFKHVKPPSHEEDSNE